MAKKFLFTIILGVLTVQSLWATEGAEDPIYLFLPITMLSIFVSVCLFIYLSGRFFFKKKGSLFFTLLGAFLGMLIFVALIIALMDKEVTVNSFSEQTSLSLYYPLIAIGGIIGYNISHAKREEKEKEKSAL